MLQLGSDDHCKMSGPEIFQVKMYLNRKRDPYGGKVLITFKCLTYTKSGFYTNFNISYMSTITGPDWVLVLGWDFSVFSVLSGLSECLLLMFGRYGLDTIIMSAFWFWDNPCICMSLDKTLSLTQLCFMWRNMNWCQWALEQPSMTVNTSRREDT